MKIKIPTGWEKLPKGVPIKRGDKFWNVDVWQTTESVGFATGYFEAWPENKPATYIRRIKRKAAK